MTKKEIIEKTTVFFEVKYTPKETGFVNTLTGMFVRIQEEKSVFLHNNEKQITIYNSDIKEVKPL